MGPEIALALAAGGTAAQMIGARKQRKEQQAILRGAMDRNERSQRAATQDVLAEGANFAPAARLAALRGQEAASATQANQDLGGGAAANIPTTAGNVSGAYLDAKNASNASESTRLGQMIAEAAAARAPGMLQGEEAQRRARLTEALNSRYSGMRNRSRAAEMDAQAVDTPAYAQLGKLASTIGSIALMAPAAGAPVIPGEDVLSGVGAWDRAYRSVPRISFGGAG